MEAPMVYPTAPFEKQDPQLNVDASAAHSGTGENVESPGKAKAVLSKVKNKAKKLRNRIKKVTGSNTAATEHAEGNEHDKRDFKGMLSPNGKEGDDGTESDEDSEEDDLGKPNDKEFKYEQLRSIGILDNQGDGSEVEVHGGDPVSTSADNPGAYWKNADDSAPISPYKTAGPPDALQATPTRYRNYAADNDVFLGEEKPTSSGDGVLQDNKPRGLEKTDAPSGLASSPEGTESYSSREGLTEPHTKHGVSDAVTISDVAVPHQEDVFNPDPSMGQSPLSHTENLSESSTAEFSEDLPKLNPSFGKSSSPIHDQIGVMDEDLSADRKLGVALSSNEPEGGALNLSGDQFSEHKPAESHSKNGISDNAVVSEPYPEDIIKPNPSFGNSSSPTHDKIAVLNEDSSPDGKFGLSSEEHSGSGKANLLETSVPECEELSGYREGGSTAPLEADELVYRPASDKEEGSSLTSPPGKLDGILYEPNVIPPNSKMDEGVEDVTSPFPSSSEQAQDLPRTDDESVPLNGEDKISTASENSYNEQKLIFDAVSQQHEDRGIATAGDGDRETWGKWSADKINNAKDVTVSALIGSNNIDELPSNESTTDARGNNMSSTADEVPISQEVEEEYYDPNEVKDNQFEEGFARGNAEEDALSGTLAGSAIEKLQGLKDTVQSSLGYATHDDGAGGKEERPVLEGEERTLSPTSQQQQKGGLVQGLRETVASTLGYGKASSDDKVSQDVSERSEIDLDHNVRQRGEGSDIDHDNRQQQPDRTYQALKSVVASKLGYAPAEESQSPTVTKETESLEASAAPPSHEPHYIEDGEHQNASKAGDVLNDDRVDPDRKDESSGQQGNSGVLQGMRNMLSSKFGYSTQPQVTNTQNFQSESESSPAEGHQASSYTEKLISSTAAAKDYLSSRVGYGSSNEEKGERGDADKITNPSAHVNNHNV